MIHSVDPVEDAKDDFEALLPFATEIERKHMEAILLHGSAKAAANALGMADTTISRAVKRVRIRAAMQGHSPKHDMVHKVPNPFIVKGVSTYYNRDGVAAGQWVKSAVDQEAYQAALQAMADGITQGITPRATIPKPANVDSDLLTVYPLGDPHSGLYAWIKETGQAFDLAEFERINVLAIDAIMAGSPKSETALYIDLGDLTHASDDKNHIDRLLEHHNNVIFRLNRGNHDPVTAVAISGMVRERYRLNPRVTVVEPYNPYWYYEFGKVMIATAHGDGAKAPQMGPIMATDQAEMWGRTRHRHAFLGHVHHYKGEDFPGVTVQYFGTLAAPDWYSHHGGYRSPRKIKSITFHKEHGEWGGATRNVSAFA
jgi:calcineurin-like phosphoesterase family protein